MKPLFKKLNILTLFLVIITAPTLWAMSAEDEIEKEIELLERRINKPTAKKLYKKKTYKRESYQYSKSKGLKKVKVLPPKKLPPKQEMLVEEVQAPLPPTYIEAPPVEQVVASSPQYIDNKTTERKPWGINVFTYYSLADRFETTQNSLSTSRSNMSRYLVDYTSEYNSSPAMGLGLEYSKKKLLSWSRFGFGFDVGTIYEFNRTIERNYLKYTNANSYAMTGVNYDFAHPDPTIALLVPYFNVNFSINKTYLFGGINFSLPQEENANDEEFEGQMGFQVGFGTQITSYLALELTHRWLSFEVNPVYNPYEYYNAAFDTYRLNRSGLGVVESETLQLNGTNLAIKLTF